MSPIAVSADRRFHRAHVRPARRRGPWRTVLRPVLKYGAVLVLVAIATTKAATFVSSSPLLQIDRIVPSGNERVSSDAVRSMLAGLEGQNILLVELEQWRAAVLQSRWVRDVSFHRLLPSTVEVLIQERTPVALARRGTRVFLIDEQGATIDEYGPEYATLDLPIVDGIADTTEDEAVVDRHAALAARLIADLKRQPAVAARLSQVDVSDARNATILLTDDPTELRIGDSQFLERVESYLGLSAALHQRVPEIDYVDLRFDGRVYVRPATRAARVATPARGRTTVNPSETRNDTRQH